MKVFINFLKIWFTIVILFSVLFYCSENKDSSYFNDLFTILGLTFIFSIPLAILLWIVLAISTQIGPKGIVLPKLLFVYFIALVSLFVYNSSGGFNEFTVYMFIAVFSSLLFYTRSILSMYAPSQPPTQPPSQPHTQPHTQPDSSINL